MKQSLKLSLTDVKKIKALKLGVFLKRYCSAIFELILILFLFDGQRGLEVSVLRVAGFQFDSQPEMVNIYIGFICVCSIAFSRNFS